MKFLYLIFIFLFFNKLNAAAVKKAPAFATPKFSDSYMPAVMQVIFNGVEQYKTKQMEELEQAALSTTIPTTISHSPGQHQPTTAMPASELLTTERPQLIEEAPKNETEKPSNNIPTPAASNADEKPELNGETTEGIYGTPETNHETPEVVHEMQEINQEISQMPVINHEISHDNSSDKLETTTIPLNFKPQHENQSNSSQEDSASLSSSSSSSSEEEEDDKKNKEPSIDSVVEEIYEIMKPQNKSKASSNSSESDESEDEDSDESDEKDENRFTMLGEKVTQVPRPSLSTYLRRSKIPSNCTTIQQLALLYDALSKDARTQGFSQYTGYSDEVLKVLETSSEGGMGSQLKQLLEKIVERREVTRGDAKIRVADTLKSLNDPGSDFNRDLRSLLPLRFQF